jgi:WLM domain
VTAAPPPPGPPARIAAPTGPPTPPAQRQLLRSLRAAIQPLLAAEHIDPDFSLAPGTRLRTAYGRCRHPEPGGRAEILIRCTADGDRRRWRRTGAIVGTLLHEVAHLRYRHHGPRFWALHRRLVDAAVERGVHDPADRDPAERARGDEKLARSAAAPVAAAARQARRARSSENRRAAAAWAVGQLGRVTAGRGALRGAVVRVLAHGRSRLRVAAANGREYWAQPGALERL